LVRVDNGAYINRYQPLSTVINPSLKLLRLQQHVAHVAEGEKGKNEKRNHFFLVDKG
jgi:hypothetical protein